YDERDPRVCGQELGPRRTLAWDDPEMAVPPLMPANCDVGFAIRGQASEVHVDSQLEEILHLLRSHPANLAAPALLSLSHRLPPNIQAAELTRPILRPRLSAMRVAVGGIFHETNTFASGLTSLDDFRAYQFAEGAALLDYSNTRSQLGGFIAGGEERGWALLPALYAAAVPSGTVEQTVNDHLTSALLERLLENGRPDGILLTLHGAMVAEHDADPDGELVERVVAAVGPDVPVVVTVAFHADLTAPIAHG